MNLSEILNLYLCTNLLLISVYFIFLICKKTSFKFDFYIGYRQWINTAQVLVILSLLTPILFHFLPNQDFPRVQWGSFHSFTENQTVPIIKNKKVNTNSNMVKERVPLELNQQNSFIDAWNWLNTDLKKNFSLILLLFLVVGFAVMLMRLFLNSIRLIQLVQSSHIIRSLGHVRVALSDSTKIPFSMKLLNNNWVVLPTDLIDKNNDFKIAIKHELQHHRQGDTLWAVIIEVLVCYFFLNPAIYLWKREITELQEFSCDENLIGQKGISSHDYGSCLLRVAEAALGSREMYVGTTYMATISKNPNYYKSFLRRRIEMFTSHERPRTYKWTGTLIGTVATILTVTVAFGAEQVLREKDQLEVNPGTVTVEPAIQAITEKALSDAIQSQKAKGGFAIVADPNTGRILAIANIDTTKKLKGYWSLSQSLEPASVIKTFVAAHAIEDGLTTLQENHLCENGQYKYGNHIYHDWKDVGWNKLTTEETIVFSSYICAMKISEKIGAEGLKKMLINFGFGPNGSAKSFPAAKSGSLPPDDDPKNPLLIPYVSAGFGFHATPIELLQAYGAIANGGNLLKPLVATQSNAEVVRRVLSTENAEKMKQILRQVVLKGTGKPAMSDRYSTAGKTATSYIPDMTESSLEKGIKKGNFGAFIGFAPVNQPKIEVYVGILEPTSSKDHGAHGGENAAPIFKRIVEDVLMHMNVPSDKSEKK